MLSGVMDSDLNVHGRENLRIADVSIMPELISGNINAPVIMTGKQCSDSILHQ